MKTQLLCTFTTQKKLGTTVSQIQNHYQIVYNKIFVFQVGDEDELVCSYNVHRDPSVQFLPGTILVHRKKDFNVIYTINALNQLIINEIGGDLDISHKINWEKYKNTIVLTGKEGPNILPTRIYDVIHLR